MTVRSTATTSTASRARRVRRGTSTPAVLALAVSVLGLSVLLAELGPFLAPHDAEAILAVPYSAPSSQYPLGADSMGRDVLSRLLCGGATLVVQPAIITAASLVVGGALGTFAGFVGGRVDAVLMRLSGLLLGIPPFLMLLVILGAWGVRPVTLVTAGVLVNLPMVLRVARAAGARALGRGYPEQASAMGYGTAAVLYREVWPAVRAALLADAGLRLVSAIYLVSAVAFLGLTAETDQVNWGVMINENLAGAAVAPYSILAPSLALVLLTVSANVTADQVSSRRAC